ncbi:MAG: hypothetical protein IT583_00670 [Verrucomicrobia bacterium]|nr:hypothetical protein [Verrucomicrobiota bacterium]
MKALTNEAVRLRGIPYNKATINNNWFVKYGVNQINAQGKMETYRNLMRVERTLDKNSITP